MTPTTLLALLLYQGSPSLLSAVPEETYAIAYCDDVAAFRERARRNDWVRLADADGAEDLAEVIDGAFDDLTGTPLPTFLDLGRDLRGEALLVLRPAGSALLTLPSADGAARVATMLRWMEERGFHGQPRTLERQGARLHVLTEATDAAADAPGRLAAVIEHPSLVALLVGESREELLAAVDTTLARLGGEERAPLLATLEEARKLVGPLGLELLVDFTHMEERADRALEDLAAHALVDPHRLLGLDRGSWLYVTADLFPGARVDLRAHLRLPPETLSARLADTFTALPPDLLSGVPKGSVGMWAISWKLADCYRVARAALAEAEQTRALATLDQGVGVASASGVELVEGVLAELSGPVLVHQSRAKEHADSILGDLERFGLELRVRDGERFQRALSSLLEMGRASAGLGETRIAERDAYLFDPEVPGRGGFAFLPDRFIVALGGGLLESALRGASGELEASAADGTRLAGAFGESQGAFWFACIEMASLIGSHAHDVDVEGLELEGAFAAQLVTTARRVPTGIDLRMSTR